MKRCEWINGNCGCKWAVQLPLEKVNGTLTFTMLKNYRSEGSKTIVKHNKIK